MIGKPSDETLGFFFWGYHEDSVLGLADPGFRHSAFALEAEIRCTRKAFECRGGICEWQTLAREIETVVTLRRDPNYPTPGYPYEVWRARYQTEFDHHLLTLHLMHSSINPSAPVTVYATLSVPGVMAESSGPGSVDIALRNEHHGRGFYCPSVTLL
ncbi:MAG TPA: hypothetical protein PKC28_03140 [Bdellovibrionales bacterium]|nr:hypothetical protein [Bdellovibrionales bacterium]